MSELLKIKLTIADRVYPLSVAPDQEEALRASAKKIDAMIKQLEQNYAVRDKQDVLAMCALQYATQLEQRRNNEKESTAIDKATLEQLNAMIEDHMATFWCVLYKEIHILPVLVYFFDKLNELLFKRGESLWWKHAALSRSLSYRLAAILLLRSLYKS